MTLKNMQRETRVLASVTWEFNTKLCLIVMYLNLMAAWGWLHGAGCMGLAGKVRSDKDVQQGEERLEMGTDVFHFSGSHGPLVCIPAGGA
jgi:hypothetical protein